MKIKGFGTTDLGKVRETNEDYFIINDVDNVLSKRYGKLYVVCDGMGGHQAGEIASKIAAEEFVKNYYSDSIQTKDIIERIKQSIQITNDKVLFLSSSDPSYQGMGTTIVGLIIKGNKAYIFNVGDSRCYLIDKNSIIQVTEDHSLVNDLLKANIISEEEAKSSSKRNVLTKSLGMEGVIEPFTKELDISNSMRFLLCTDGLWNTIKDNEIYHIFSENDIKSATEELIALANERGGPDNITAIGVEINKAKTLMNFLVFSFVAIIFLIGLFLFNFCYKQITIEIYPTSTLISVNNRTYNGIYTGRLKEGKPLEIIINKGSYSEERLNISVEQSKIYYEFNGMKFEVENKNFTLPIKLVNLVVADEDYPQNEITDAIVLIDDEKIPNLKDPIPLTLGTHKISVSTEDGLYQSITKTIEISENPNENEKVFLKRMPLLTIKTNPENAKIFIFDQTKGQLEQIKDKNGNPATSSEESLIDLNLIKGKKLIFVKDIDKFYIHYGEAMVGDLPSSEIIELNKVYTKINIHCDLINAKFYDSLGNKLIKIGTNEYLVSRKVKDWFSVKGTGIEEDFNVSINTIVNIARIGNIINFTFHIFDFSNSSVEFLGNGEFRGKINGKDVKFDSNNKILNLTEQINRVEGDYTGYHYSFIKDSN